MPTQTGEVAEHAEGNEFPKAVALGFDPPAGYYVRRIIGHLLDVTLLAIAAFFLLVEIAARAGHVTPTSAHLDGWPVLVWLGLATAVTFAYFTLLELGFGRTLGKMLVGQRVGSAAGGRCNARQALLRNLVRIADSFPLFVPGLVAFFATRHKQRLGDLAANTIVRDAPAAKLRLAGGVAWVAVVAVLILAILAGFRAASGLQVAGEPYFTDEAGNIVPAGFLPGQSFRVNIPVAGVKPGEGGEAEFEVRYRVVDPRNNRVTGMEDMIEGPANASLYATFVLPEFAMGGHHRVEYWIRDRVADDSVEGVVEFEVQGPVVDPDAPFGVSDIRCVTDDPGGPLVSEGPVELYCEVLLYGFQVGEDGLVAVGFSASIIPHGGGESIPIPAGTLEEKFEYRPPYLPIMLSAPEVSAPGEYEVVFNAVDQLGGKDATTTRTLKVKPPADDAGAPAAGEPD